MDTSSCCFLVGETVTRNWQIFVYVKNVKQEQLETLRTESSELARDRLKQEMSTLENNCREKSDEIERLNNQLTANSTQLQVSRANILEVFRKITYFIYSTL